MSGSVLGLVLEGTVESVDLKTGIVEVSVNMMRAGAFKTTYKTSLFASWSGPQGEFSGGIPQRGASVKIEQGQGGVWYISGYSLSHGVISNANSNYPSMMSDFKPGRHVTQVRGGVRQYIDPFEGIVSGSASQYTHEDPISGIKSQSFDSFFTFSDSHYNIVGPVKRLAKSDHIDLKSHEYSARLTEIGLDPKTRAGTSYTRNPSFVESRNIVYEYRSSDLIYDDITEQKIYDGELPSINKNINLFRSNSRADALSLSLVDPNRLIEEISGTVVDIFGNPLDLNRAVIKSGTGNLSLRNNEQELSKTYRELRAETRKTIAYHFEINSRKDTLPDINNIGGYINNSDDYSRNRSRFSIDIDKEGQFKVNVPASSETGNIGLLTRSENYSVISAAADNEDNDPRLFYRNVDNTDVFLDSFGTGSVFLSGSTDGEQKGLAAPIDRLTGEPIKLGTAYHDILKSAELHDIPGDILPIPTYPESKINLIPKIGGIVSDNIIVSGDKANAGGRSGTISLDGHLSMSIGANTIDRQSLWLDCAGGIVANIGRDKKGISCATKFDGDILITVGGKGIDGDSRFENENNDYRDGAIDIRVATSNQMHVIRIDNSGVRVFTPGEIDIVSDGHMRLGSRRGNLYLNGEGIYMYADDHNTARWVSRKPGQSID